MSIKRGPKKPDSQLVNLWVPKVLVPALDKGVQKEDSDRSKFIRNAVRDKLRKLGIQIPEEEIMASPSETTKRI